MPQSSEVSSDVSGVAAPDDPDELDAIVVVEDNPDELDAMVVVEDDSVCRPPLGTAAAYPSNKDKTIRDKNSLVAFACTSYALLILL